MDKDTKIIIGWTFACLIILPFLLIVFIQSHESHERRDPVLEAIQERNRIYIIERGAEDDAADKALSEHQEVNYVRCFLRPAGYVTCQVHTPPMDVEAYCRARGPREFLVDGNRCRWTSPSSMAHP
jgi:hypothetical protein